MARDGAGPGRPAAVEAPDADGRHSSLVRKYRDLTSKYDDLVQKYETLANERFGVFRMAWWAMRATASGLALVRADAVVLSNTRFDDLHRAQGARPGWRSLDAEAREFPGLRELAMHQARALAEQPSVGSLVGRFERIGAEQVIELQVEAIAEPMPYFITVAMVRDVTGFVRTERELARTRAELEQRARLRAVGELAAGVAHDLNNVLSAMRLRLDGLRAQVGATRARGQGTMLTAELDTVSALVADASQTVTRLRDFARAPLETTSGSIDLASVVAEAVEMARPELERHASRIRLAVDGESMGRVRANAAEVRHAVVNLLLNARDAMPFGGLVRIDVRPGEDPRNIVLQVTDEGTGIAPEHAERIFEPFFTTKGLHGTGLGLVMVKATMDRVGGTVAARPASPRGTVLELVFPIVADHATDGTPARP